MKGALALGWIFAALMSTPVINGVALAQASDSGSAEKQKDIKEPGFSRGTMVDAKGRKITVIDFEDAVIEGSAKAPDGTIIKSRGNSKFSSILKLRRDFRPQITASSATGMLVSPSSP